nr:uncharacterized protein LOC108080782 [Drosophila kikkawai]
MGLLANRRKGRRGRSNGSKTNSSKSSHSNKTNSCSRKHKTRLINILKVGAMDVRLCGGIVALIGTNLRENGRYQHSDECGVQVRNGFDQWSEFDSRPDITNNNNRRDVMSWPNAVAIRRILNHLRPAGRKDQ